MPSALSQPAATAAPVDTCRTSQPNPTQPSSADHPRRGVLQRQGHASGCEYVGTHQFSPPVLGDSVPARGALLQARRSERQHRLLLREPPHMTCGQPSAVKCRSQLPPACNPALPSSPTITRPALQLHVPAELLLSGARCAKRVLAECQARGSVRITVPPLPSPGVPGCRHRNRHHGWALRAWCCRVAAAAAKFAAVV